MNLKGKPIIRDAEFEKSIFNELIYSIFDEVRKSIILDLNIEEKYVKYELEKMKR